MGKKNKQSKYDKLSFWEKDSANRKMAELYNINPDDYVGPNQMREDYTGRNLIAVALNDENLASETRTFDCGTLISGMMLEFSGDANFANFENGLQVSGEQVATGKVDLPQLGGQQILSEGSVGSVLFGGSDGSDKKDLSFLHGGEEKMRITEVGVDIKPALTVNSSRLFI